jgi:type I restriction enzyme M protein
MFGAIIGDMVGSIYEFHNHRSKEFPLFNSKCFPTDDSIMTIAVAKAILENDGKAEGLEDKTVEWMQKIGRQYPNCGYGGRFYEWMYARNPHPYNSFGNGAAMRVSACGWAGKTLEEVKALSHAVTVVTHNHPEGVKGAEATACAIFLARTRHSKEEIRAFIEDNCYTLDFMLDEIRPTYRFDVTCQGSVPQAIEAFLESTSFEDAIRNAISIGGDSDTIAAITGSIAEAFYGIPEDIRKQAISQFRFACRTQYLYATVKNDPDLLAIVEAFEQRYGIKNTDE